jgi:peptidyl-prolyl cis-trans isomerase C
MRRRYPIAMFLCVLASIAMASAQQPGMPSAKTPADNPVVARVQGETITEKDVLDAIERIARQQPMMGDQMKQKNSMYFKEALDTLVGLTLLKNEAKEKGITADKTKIDEAWEMLKKRFPSEEQFKQAMASQGFAEADVRKQIGDNLIMQQLADSIMAGQPGPSDQEIEAFYNSNPQYFQSPEQVHAAHILIKVEGSAPAEKKAEARKTIEAIRADIESKKITFEEAAKKSDDKSNADKGGDLGFFPRGQMVKPFEDAAFAAQPGSLSDVVETQFGYHIIRIDDKKPAGKTPLAEARKSILSFLDRAGKQKAVQNHINELKQKSKVEQVMSDADWNNRNGAK